MQWGYTITFLKARDHHYTKLTHSYTEEKVMDKSDTLNSNYVYVMVTCPVSFIADVSDR